MKNERMLKEAPVWKLLCSMSLPMILIMLVQVLYNMADVFFMGRSGSYMQVAAISLAAPIFSVISAFNTLIGFGGCTAVSMALGRGDTQKGKQYASFVLWSGLASGVLVGAVILAGMKPIVSLLGANAETAGFTADYLRILAIGAPVSIASGALGNTLRADGESKGAVVAMMLGTVANIILDPILISGLGMGIRGAAYATVIGNAISFVAMVREVRKNPFFSSSLKDLKLSSWKILGYGVPMAAGTLLMSLSSVFSNRMLVAFGNDAVAAHGVAGKAGMLITMMIMGICMGVQPAVSFNYGAGDRKRVQRIVVGVGLFSVLFGTVLAAGIFLMRQGFVGAFVEDPEVVGLGVRMVTAGLIGVPLFGVYQITSVYLQGTGKVSYATVTSLLRQGIILVPVLVIMTNLFGLTGFIYSAVIADVISTGLGFCLALKWKQEQEEKKKPLPRPVAAKA
ncbi:MAG: MATE family efflux transporter [Firmicutes bacterium]|nr:MATE family efflux transporter [Bacillota bacterium]